MQVEDLERRLAESEKGEWSIRPTYDEAEDDTDDNGCTDRNN